MSEYDEEPRIHTVISPDSTNSNTFFNSIAFSIPRREDSNVAAAVAGPLPSTDSQQQQHSQANIYSDNSVRISSEVNYDDMSMSLLADDLQSGDHLLEINTQQNASQINQYQGEPQGPLGSGNQQNDGQGFYTAPSQPAYTFENQHQPIFYENLNQIPPEYNYQPQSQQILYDNQPSQVVMSYENQAQVPLDQSQQIPVSYVNQSPLSYETQPPEITYNSQQQNPHQLAYETQQMAYTDPQQVYIDPIQFPRQDQPISQLDYDGQSQIAYGSQTQDYISNPNDVLYNSQQAQVTYQNEAHATFQSQMQSRSSMQSPVYSEADATGEDTNLRHYSEPSSNAEINIVKKLENLELGVEAGIDAQELNSCSYSNEKLEPQQPELFYGGSLPIGDAVYQNITSTPEEVQTAEIYPGSSQIDGFSDEPYSSDDSIYDRWVPSEETKNVLKNNAEAVRAGTYFPDKSHMTAPGVIYADDLVDKVGVNMARIFGEAEACKRKILTADSVTQDDSGLRELIKLGCYRSAINLTKRLLTLYGQGPGKVGHYSKQTPHTLQLWFTRISLLMRIREFSIAESEIAAFKNFENPDMYYDYYPDTYGSGRTGSMVPFHFRLLAAEVPQYVRKFNETANGLNQILLTIKKIIQIIGKGEDGQESVKEEVSSETDGIDALETESDVDKNLVPSGAEKVLDPIEAEKKEKSLAIWKNREIRTLYAVVNASLFSKDYYNAFTMLTKLFEKDLEHRPQIKSAIGRLFLQHGDLTTAQNYFLEAADLRSGESDSDSVDTLIDSALTSIAQNAYPEAFLLFQQALQIQPENFMVTNNMAVCLLYMGNVKDALALMESNVKQNTPQLLQENVILNLSTIYELENSDGYKKNALLKLISQYKGDGINLASLKMPNLI